MALEQASYSRAVEGEATAERQSLIQAISVPDVTPKPPTLASYMRDLRRERYSDNDEVGAQSIRRIKALEHAYRAADNKYKQQLSLFLAGRELKQTLKFGKRFIPLEWMQGQTAQEIAGHYSRDQTNLSQGRLDLSRVTFTGSNDTQYATRNAQILWSMLFQHTLFTSGKIMSLDLSEARLGSVDAHTLTQLFAQLPSSLKTLKLCRNGLLACLPTYLSGASIKHAKTLLSTLSSVEDLDISGNFNHINDGNLGKANLALSSIPASVKVVTIDKLTSPVYTPHRLLGLFECIPATVTKIITKDDHGEPYTLNEKRVIAATRILKVFSHVRENDIDADTQAVLLETLKWACDFAEQPSHYEHAEAALNFILSDATNTEALAPSAARLVNLASDHEIFGLFDEATVLLVDEQARVRGFSNEDDLKRALQHADKVVLRYEPCYGLDLDMRGTYTLPADKPLSLTEVSHMIITQGVSVLKVDGADKMGMSQSAVNTLVFEQNPQGITPHTTKPFAKAGTPIQRALKLQHRIEGKGALISRGDGNSIVDAAIALALAENGIVQELHESKRSIYHGWFTERAIYGLLSAIVTHTSQDGKKSARDKLAQLETCQNFANLYLTKTSKSSLFEYNDLPIITGQISQVAAAIVANNPGVMAVNSVIAIDVKTHPAASRAISA